MPGGICASSNVLALDQAAVRCAELLLDVRGNKFSVYLGGCAKARFMELDDPDEAVTRDPSAELTVEWESAVFYGVDPVLGPIYAYLRPPSAAPQRPVSRVVSLAAREQPREAGAAPGSFFPATNRNFFNFRIRMPRIGVVLDSQEPVVNSARITTIPPMNVEYKLEAPVEFEINRSRSNAIGGALTNALTGKIVLEACRVKLLELQGLKCDIRLVSSDWDTSTFEIEVLNESTEDKVTATWMMWPRPEEETSDAEGVLQLEREPVKSRIRVPRDLFYRERWLAISITRPFETDAGFAGRFPAIE
jgi:hypothetical protein